MQRGGQILIIVGVILALLTAGLVFMATRAPAPVIPTKPVVVAVQDIAQRVAIQAPMLGVKDWPADAVPVGALSTVEDAVGKVSATNIYIGEPILQAKLEEAKAIYSLSYVLPPGMVAFSIPASEVAMAGGAVQPGDFVDVLVSLNIVEVDAKGNESLSQETTQLVLQDVKVLLVGAWTPPPAAASPGQAATTQTTKPIETRTITLMVNQQDALVLKYAREQGSIDLVLRAFNDHDPMTTDSVYVKYMIERFKFARPPLKPVTAPAK